MSKIFIVARREFLSRVQKKTFLLSTILLPLVIFGFYAMIIYFSVKTDDALTIAVADRANLFNKSIDDADSEMKFVFVNDSDEALRKKLQSEEFDAYISVPAEASLMQPGGIKVTTGKAMGIMTQEKIQRRVNNTLEENRLLSLNIQKSTLDSIQNREDIPFVSMEGDGEKGNVAGIAYGVGMIAGLLIYLVLFIYGTMVMRGVMEEKMNRIAEVIVSSVKPFQLMMGKIIGIGAVGLLQFIIWGVLVFALQMLLPLLFPEALGQIADGSAMQASGLPAGQQMPPSAMAGIMEGLRAINILFIFLCFLFYFLGGYLLYSSLFAAVGSAVNEDPQDAQSLMLPITFPIIFAIVIMTKAVNDPTSGLALFGSLFPLTSPIVMMGRLPYGVPAWELITSFVLLIGGFVGTTWLAAKIYRTGILMYGKKVTWKEMWKWAFRKA